MSYTAMVPLVQNVPEPSHDDWQLTSCPQCGRPCWYMGTQAAQIKRVISNTRFLCTACTLRSQLGRESSNEK